MIRGGFLDPSMRADLIALMRDGKAETRLTRRANALVLLDDGISCEAIAKVLYLDDDTIRYWYALYAERGPSWLADFGYKGRACELTAAQQDDLKEWVAQTRRRFASPASGPSCELQEPSCAGFGRLHLGLQRCL